jgi:hypothetical protein
MTIIFLPRPNNTKNKFMIESNILNKIMSKTNLNNKLGRGGDFYNWQRGRKGNSSLLSKRANQLYCIQLYNRFAH